MAYTNQTKVEDYLNTSLAGISSLSSWIASVALFIDNYLGKSFEVTAATTRYYDGNGSSILLIDSVHTITSFLILNETGGTENTLLEGADEDYILYPLNTEEKNEVRLNADGQVASFPAGNKRVSITGKFGADDAVPADIELVATMLVAEICRDRLKGGDVQSESLGDYSVTYKTLDEKSKPLGIYTILDHYRDIPL